MANTPNLDLENVNVLLDTDYAYNQLVSEIIAKINNNNLKIDGLPNNFIPSSQKGIANGVATLGNDGIIPKAQLPIDGGSVERVADILARDAITNLYDNKLVFVMDATGDTTVISGWAMYIYSIASLSWTKIIDGESLDIQLIWDNIANKPTVFPPDTHDHSQITTNANNILDLQNNKVDKIEGSRLVSETEITVFNDKYSKTEVDNKLSMLETNIDWKESVATFADIATTYPVPEDGWTVNTRDTDYTYRYNGTSWVAISANAIPKATTSVDGLMSKEDKLQVDTNKTDILSLEATVGDVAITTSAQTVKGAINELDADIGNKSTLITTDKTNLVNAVNENREQINTLVANVKTYGAKGDGVTDDSLAIKNTIDYAIANKKRIFFPKGRYLVNSAIVNNLNSTDLIIEGETRDEFVPHQTEILWRGGAGIMFTFNSCKNVKFLNIAISGYDYGVDVNCLSVGSIGIKADGSVILENVTFLGFENFIEWNGGYYHKFINCYFRFTKIGFKNFNANNLIFDKCKAFDFETLLTVSGGSGTVVIDKCSIEKWVNSAFLAVSGNNAHISINNSYFENFPSTTPPSGITGNYTSAFAINGFGSAIVQGNTIFTNGIRRFIFGTTTLKHVTSIGNRILYSNSASGDLEYYILNGGSLETIIANDIADNILTQSGAYTPTYINNFTGVKDSSSKIYNPFTKKDITPVSWTTLTLLNNWTGSAGYGYAKDSAGVVRCRGRLLAGTKTDGTVLFTLPEGFRPAYNKMFTYGTVRILVTTGGNVEIYNITTDTYIEINGINFVEGS